MAGCIVMMPDDLPSTSFLFEDVDQWHANVITIVCGIDVVTFRKYFDQFRTIIANEDCEHPFP